VPHVFPLGRVQPPVSSVRKIVHFRAADGAVFGKTVGAVVGRKSRRTKGTATSEGLFRAGFESRRWVRHYRIIIAVPLFVFTNIMGEVTRPERLKTGAKSQWGEPYRQRAEFFALPARPFAGFRYVVKP
jgi:hypothetical protein